MKLGTIAVATALSVLVASCGSGSFLESVFSLEKRAAVGATPYTIDELKAAIARYGADIERVADARGHEADYWRMLAYKYLDERMYGDAHDAAMKALYTYPDNPGLYYVAGVSAAYFAARAAADPNAMPTRAQWLDAAEAAYQESIQLGQNTKAMYGLAVLYSFEMERHEDALVPLEALLAKDPGNLDALFVYARSLYGAGRPQDAVDAYDRILASAKVEETKALATENKKRILGELYGE